MQKARKKPAGQMTKAEAMEALGCDTITQLAQALDISKQAVSMWPDKGPLPDSAVRRVESKLFRARR